MGTIYTVLLDFNDGDACTFTVSEASIRFDGDDQSGEYEDGYFSIWEIKYYNKEYPRYSDEIENKILSFDKILQFGSHYTILAEKFGDPARVVAKLNESGELEFNVEFYEHD